MTLDELNLFLALSNNTRLPAQECEIFSSDDEVVLHYIKVALYHLVFPRGCGPRFQTINDIPYLLYSFRIRVLKDYSWKDAEPVFLRYRDKDRWARLYWDYNPL